MPPEIGDVVTYTARRFDGSSVASFTHRIISGNNENGFVMKGDNNPAPDTQKPKLSDITGVVFFTIPLIGKLLTPAGLIVLVPSIFGLWLIRDSLRNETKILSICSRFLTNVLGAISGKSSCHRYSSFNLGARKISICSFRRPNRGNQLGCKT
jgi:hypothetical protein